MYMSTESIVLLLKIFPVGVVPHSLERSSFKRFSVLDTVLTTLNICYTPTIRTCTDYNLENPNNELLAVV